MDSWKNDFLDKLTKAQTHWVSQFEDALDNAFVPVFNDMRQFLGDNGFELSTPLREQGRRSFKFELAENAYLLMIFRSTGVGEFELRCESFVPGNEPALNKVVARTSDLDKEWVTRQVQQALDAFVDLLAGRNKVAEPEPEELVEV